MALARYEMREHVLDGCIAVEALLYTHWEQRPGLPPPPPIDFLYSPTIRYVRPPGFIARLFEDTLEKRLDRARRAVTAKAERMIARDAKLIKAVG